MKKIIKAMKLLLLICLIVLAGFGIGMSGGIPIPSATKRQEIIEAKTELLDSISKEKIINQKSII